MHALSEARQRQVLACKHAAVDGLAPNSGSVDTDDAGGAQAPLAR